MRKILDWIASRRAESLAARLRPHLSGKGRILDVGSGTGHNAAALRARGGPKVSEVDVANLSWNGHRPVLFDGRALPFEAGRFDAVVGCYLFQYPRDPERLLAEMRRVARGEIVVIQSTYRGRAGLAWLRSREFFLGRLPCRALRALGMIRADGRSLEPRRYYTRESFAALVKGCSLRVKRREAEAGRRWVSRDLYVLERA